MQVVLNHAKHYGLRVSLVNSSYKGQNSLRYFGVLIWNFLSFNLKNVKSPSEFKGSIRKWKPNNCTCRLCKTYVDCVGFA